MIEQFERTIVKSRAQLRKAQQKYNLLGYIKLLFAIIFIFALHMMFRQWETTAWKIAGGSLFIIQVALWIRHQQIGEKIAHANGIIEINENHISRSTGKWVEFPDVGAEYIDHTHPYSSDLDIVGNKSLFQFINTTHTWYGRQAFSMDLLHSEYTPDEIVERQKACQELSQNHQLLDELEYSFSKIGVDPSTPKFVNELQDTRPLLKNSTLRIILSYFPLLLFGFAGLTIIFRWPPFYWALFLCYAVQAITWGISLPATTSYLKTIQKLPYKLSAYSGVIELIKQAEFVAPALRHIQAEVSTSEVSAFQAIKELSKISDRASIRNNPIVYFILNVLLLWDFECVFALSDWKAKYGPHCERWFLSLGTLESLGCFATLRKVSDHTCYPHITDNRGISACELGHPLLSGKKRVNNPLDLRNGIIIISGSNMSGKTTYLRTVGINIILARAGGPVCAQKMTCSILIPYTSMRIADDLNEGISTFYAELKRIKNILVAAQNERNTLFLIDEIFRGTNSVDRLIGAKTVLSKLSQLGAIGFITTHDLQLCNMAAENHKIRNFSFAEDYRDGKIVFDYKLKPGKSKTSNAQYLMALLDIL